MKQLKKGRYFSIILFFVIVLIVLFFLSFFWGRYAVSPRELIDVFLSRFGIGEVYWSAQTESIIFQVRMPRILLACLVGCCLSAAGASYQGIFQNPMAAPDFLGASSGAALGACLAILLGMNSAMITVFAFVCSIVTVLVVMFVARCAPGNRVVSLVLAGIIISSLCSSGISYIKLVADTEDQLPAITYWLMGSLAGTDLRTALWVMIPMAVGLIPLVLLSWKINILTVGDEEAVSMGVHVQRVRTISILCATLVTAASVSVSGMIGWIGLVIPHFARMLVGNNYVRMMPLTMVLGAVFLLIVDDISRNLLATEIPIGILTSIVGAPFFIYLMVRRENGL